MLNNGPAAVCTVICRSIHLYCSWLSACAAGDSHHGRVSRLDCLQSYFIFLENKKIKSPTFICFGRAAILERQSNKKKINPHTVCDLEKSTDTSPQVAPPPAGAHRCLFFFLALDRRVGATTERQQSCCQVYLPETAAAKASSEAAAAGSQDGKC